MSKKFDLGNNTYMIETALFIASSSREVIKWEQYGSLRLSQTLIKFLNLPNEIEILEKDAFLEKIKNEVENNMDLRRDKEKYEQFLDSLILKMMDEYKKRLGLTS
jgi:hypothetical protein